MTQGHAGIVACLLAKEGIDVNNDNVDGVTPLFIASQNGHAECVSLLLADPSININHTNNMDGATPLYIA